MVSGAVALFLIAAAPAPKAVSELKADFNGDGKVDRAAIETTAKGWRLMARLAGLGAKGVFMLEDEAGAPDGFYIKAAKPGRYDQMCEDGDRRCQAVVQVRWTAIEFGKEESGAQVIYWDGKRFARVQRGD